MARIAIIETYPYEADWGGEAVYLDRLRQFLQRGGHHVDNLVTDVTRGRATPLLTLRMTGNYDPHWRVRGAVEWRTGQFLATDPRLAVRAAGRLVGYRGIRDDPISDAECEWALKQVATLRPDIVIPAFGACRLSAALVGGGFATAAIKGFFPERVTRLGAPQAPPTDISAPILDEMRAATLACFNNAADLALYGERSGANNGVLLGMGFERHVLPASAEPVLLFVGAYTRPNVQALRWFLDGCWSAVLAARPDAHLRVVGTVRRGFDGETIAGVEFIGFAPDLTDAYRRAQMVIAPLLVGTNGIKTKVAEALSHGRPVVTTSVGVDPDQPEQFGDAVAVADDPAIFAREVVALLTDEQIRARRTAAVADQYERHFSERAAYGLLAALIDRLSPAPATSMR